MKHLVYKTTNTVNGKYYIGVHSCKCNPCNYLGSGSALKNAIKKYGRDKFVFQVISQHTTRKLALKCEARLVNVSDPMSYNIIAGGGGYYTLTNRPTKLTLEHRKSLSDSVSLSRRKIISENFKGRKLSQTTKSKISKSKMKRVKTPNGDFDSISQALVALGVGYDYLNRRLKDPKNFSYEYL